MLNRISEAINSAKNLIKKIVKGKLIMSFIGFLAPYLIFFGGVVGILVSFTFISKEDRNIAKANDIEQINQEIAGELYHIAGNKQTGYYYEFNDDIDEKIDSFIDGKNVKFGNFVFDEREVDRQLIKRMLKAELVTQLPDLGGAPNKNVTTNNSGSKVVVINPGHSVGYDSGAEGNGAQEAKLNENVAGQVVKNLVEKGYDAKITHSTQPDMEQYKLLSNEEGDSLDKVVEATNAQNPGLAMAIHHDSAGSSASGSTIIWSSYRPWDTEGVYEDGSLWSGGNGSVARLDSTPCQEAQDSQRFAEVLKQQVETQPNIPFRKIMERDDRLPANAKCPCVLYEGGFVSNPTEAAYMLTDQYVQEVSKRIADAIDSFLGGPGGSGASGEVVGGPVSKDTPIMGISNIQPEQIAQYYTNHGAPYPDYYTQRGVDLNKFAQIYVEEAKAEGVRADIAFCQTMLETAWLQFGNDVSISQFNFAGIGATGGRSAGI